MKVIVSHMNLDFDGLASMLAAKKLYPDAKIVITDKLNPAVKQFLAIYRDSIDLIQDHQIPWEEVTHLIIVDVASLQRIGDFTQRLHLKNILVTLYDHHTREVGDVIADQGKVESVGATVTLLIEEIRQKGLDISSFEATVFGLGLYTDTGAFTYSNTTARDLEAASYLFDQGMKLELVNRFSNQVEFGDHHVLFSQLNQLLIHSKEFLIDGLNILVSSYQRDKFQGGLSTLTRKLLEITGADAVFTIVDMQKRVYVVGRASSNRVNLIPILSLWGGGGHEKSASATIKNGNLEEIVHTVYSNLKFALKPAINARAIMVSPVKTIAPETTIEVAAKLMYRYGHSGFPVVSEEEKLVGIISRRDLDKATHHGLGHAPVKAYMSTKVIAIDPNTSLEEIQSIMIKHDIGRLPVIEAGKLIGILSRTNVIEILHNDKLKIELESAAIQSKNNLTDAMKKQLSPMIFELLQQIGQGAQDQHVQAYLIGGIVRDLILERENVDIDIVIVGESIPFAHYLATTYGGEVKTHDTFGTATWITSSDNRIDLVTSRFEYYEFPAALPIVEHANLKADLSRRDFTINAMAISLNLATFGDIIDFHNGREHITEKCIRILHNLSFVEDPTRVFRAVRFEIRFGFAMDEHTLELAAISMDNVKALSKTRIMNELHKLFSEGPPLLVLQRLFEIKLWQVLIEEPSSEEVVMTHGKKLVYALEERSGDWFLYMLLPYYNQQNWQNQITSYTLNRKQIKLVDEISQVNNIWDSMNKETSGSLHQQLSKISHMAIIFFISHPNRDEEYELVMQYLKDRKQMPQWITGKDLKDFGLKSGPIFSHLLHELEKAYLDKQIGSKEEAVEWLKVKIQ